VFILGYKVRILLGFGGKSGNHNAFLGFQKQGNQGTATLFAAPLQTHA